MPAPSDVVNSNFLFKAAIVAVFILLVIFYNRSRLKGLSRRVRFHSISSVTKSKLCSASIFLLCFISFITFQIPTEKWSCLTKLANFSNVTQSEFRIQVVAATPGSGSDYCRISLGVMTGFITGSVYDLMRLNNTNQQPYLPIYYKTHYPFIESVGKVDKYINTNPQRAVVLIRNPFDAAFSEWIRQKVSLVNKDIDDKYNNMDGVVTEDDILMPPSAAQINRLPSIGFMEHMQMYLSTWKQFHKYWLSNYTGSVKVMLYQDLVDDITKFTEIAKYFGYKPWLTAESKLRLLCFYDNIHTTNYRKRPSSPVIDRAKETVKIHFESLTTEAITYVGKLYKKKYNRTLLIP